MPTNSTPACRCLLIALCAFLIACYQPTPVGESTPKLVVLIAFDQMRGDYISRWFDQFRDGGFRRMCDNGAWFTNCHYPYACTETAPGHASLSTGCSPDRHGIIGNEWYDRASSRQVYSAGSERYRQIYSDAVAKERGSNAGSPEKLLVPTFADLLKQSTNGNAKVVALSCKDRAACLLGGKQPDACYWFDTRSGGFVTSNYYRDAVHDWVRNFNRRHLADQWFQKSWERFRPDLDYDKLAGPDDVAFEIPGARRKQGRVFPHPFSVPSSGANTESFEELVCSPFGNELLFEFTKTAIQEHELGRHSATDYLCVSFSCNDPVGHAFGPDSQEVFDVTLRSDDLIARLLKLLDDQVGSGNYLVALSADHGVCPFPELAAANHPQAMRVSKELIRTKIDSVLDQQFPGHDEMAKSKWIEHWEFPWVYLNHEKIKARGATVEQAAETLHRLTEDRWIAAAYTRRDLESPETKGSYLPEVRKSYQPDRAGDLFIILQPYCLCMSGHSGTTHGTPHSYDTHVPLIFFGHGIAKVKSDELVAPQSLVPVFCQALGFPPPERCDSPIPPPLLQKSKVPAK